MGSPCLPVYWESHPFWNPSVRVLEYGTFVTSSGTKCACLVLWLYSLKKTVTAPTFYQLTIGRPFPSLKVNLRGVNGRAMGAGPLRLGTHGPGAGVTCLHVEEAAKLGWVRDSSDSSFINTGFAGITCSQSVVGPHWE